jgi:hypothetical protein
MCIENSFTALMLSIVDAQQLGDSDLTAENDVLVAV